LFPWRNGKHKMMDITPSKKRAVKQKPYNILDLFYHEVKKDTLWMAAKRLPTSLQVKV